MPPFARRPPVEHALVRYASGVARGVAEALARLELPGAWIDGELIVTDPNGRSDFSLPSRLFERPSIDRLT